MTHLHIDELGAGPAVVLLHGAPTRPAHLHGLAARLAPTHRALVVHLPGYGESPALEPYDLARTHALVEDALLARGVSTADFVGFSGGGYRALALACRGRVRPRRVVSLAGFADVTPAEAEGARGTAAAIRGGLDLRALLPELMLSPAAKQRPDAVEEVRTWATAIAPKHLADEIESFATAADLVPGLVRLGLPVLLRAGSLDAASPLDRSARLAAALPSATLEVVEGAGHALLLEDLEATTASVLRHLQAG